MLSRWHQHNARAGKGDAWELLDLGLVDRRPGRSPRVLSDLLTPPRSA